MRPRMQITKPNYAGDQRTLADAVNAFGRSEVLRGHSDFPPGAPFALFLWFILRRWMQDFFAHVWRQFRNLGVAAQLQGAKIRHD